MPLTPPPPPGSPLPVGRRIAVVGAGLAGLVCARTLADHGHQVTVFDKGRSPGGRSTSRREEGDRVFDHGAQFFTARSEWLRRHVEVWEREGVVARWTPRIVGARTEDERAAEAWWVGTPRMGALAAHLARGLDVRLGEAVTAVSRSAGAWSVTAGDVHQADALVIAIPAAQCAALVGPSAASSLAIDVDVQTPCWAVMLTTGGGPPADADVYEDRDGAIAWAAREASKPGRTPREGEELWTLHASTAWSMDHLESSPESVAAVLGKAFVDARLGGTATVVHARAHRWRFARGAQKGGPLFDAARALVVCGDWRESARVEGALASGFAAANRLLAP